MDELTKDKEIELIIISHAVTMNERENAMLQ